MKKSSIIYMLCGASLLVTPACTDLDETIYGTVDADNFGRTEAEIEAIMGPVYRTFSQYHTHTTFGSLDCAGDMPIVPTRVGGDWYDAGQFRELHQHTWTASTNALDKCWNIATKAIASCNLVYSTVEGRELDAEIKKRTLAEIRGIRAFWIYVMIDNFGNFPLVTSYGETELPEVTPRKEAYDFLIKELTEIKEQLISEVSGTTYGKFTKGSALAILAKSYLNAEAWGVDSPRWQEVIDACDEAMTLGYMLEPDYKTNFQINNEISREAMLVAVYSVNDPEIKDYPETRNQLFLWTLHYNARKALGIRAEGHNGLSAQPDYVKLFDEADSRLEGSFLLGEMRDPDTKEILLTAHDRPLIHTKDITILTDDNNYDPATGWGAVHQEDGARCWKWPIDKSVTTAAENDIHIFRYADIYLMKAEALVRLGRNAEATSLVNTIRERGFGNSDHNYTTVTLDEIMLERKLEFAWENFSRQDCIRFGTFFDARFVKKANHGEEYRKIFAIPLNAWQANPKLKQNTGYPPF
ncbi:MAG: RagB/SusD family nutrient uptake outer membrane protein [Tannerellaceae bacterium]|nr:RagB/SusD family nutrient uptake outer membrane protein [Tannerellaceae bacterium]